LNSKNTSEQNLATLIILKESAKRARAAYKDYEKKLLAKSPALKTEWEARSANLTNQSNGDLSQISFQAIDSDEEDENESELTDGEEEENIVDDDDGGDDEEEDDGDDDDEEEDEEEQQDTEQRRRRSILTEYNNNIQ